LSTAAEVIGDQKRFAARRESCNGSRRPGICPIIYFLTCECELPAFTCERLDMQMIITYTKALHGNVILLESARFVTMGLAIKTGNVSELNVWIKQ